MGEEISKAMSASEIFRFSIGKFNIVITDSLITMWLIMIALTIVAYIFSRDLKTIPGKRQSLVEAALEFVGGICKKSIGHYWKAFVPYIATLALFLIVCNMAAIFNIIPTAEDLYKLTNIEFFERLPSYSIKPPTRDINVTAGFATMTMVVVISSVIYYKGFFGWLKSLCKPVAIMLPMNVIDLFIKPVSLCLRLFGNVLGAFITMEMIYILCPVLIPAALSMYFDLFDGMLQAYIFVFLTTVYIGEGLED